MYRDFEQKKTRVYRQKIKFDHWGTDGFSEYDYDIESKRYFQGELDKKNWITREDVQISVPLKPNTEFYHDPTEPRKDVESFTPSLEEPPF